MTQNAHNNKAEMTVVCFVCYSMRTISMSAEARGVVTSSVYSIDALRIGNVVDMKAFRKRLLLEIEPYQLVG